MFSYWSASGQCDSPTTVSDGSFESIQSPCTPGQNQYIEAFNDGCMGDWFAGKGTPTLIKTGTVSDNSGVINTPSGGGSYYAEISDLSNQYSIAFHYLYQTSFKEGDWTTVENLLLEDGSFSSIRKLIGLKLRTGAFSEAQAYLQALPVETDDQSIVADLLALEVDYRSNTVDYILSDGDEAYLQLLAEDTLSSTYTYSRALLGRLTRAQFHLPIAADDTVEGLMQSNQNHLPASQLKKREEQISIIPNPAQSQISVLLPGAPDANWTIDLFSAQGVGVRTLQVQGSQVEIKLQSLPSGLYFMRASQAGSGESHQQQLIIR